MDDLKQATQNQYVAIFLVVFGAVALFVGCHYHYAELSTSAAGIGGAGINMLTTQIRNTQNNRGGGNVQLGENPQQAA